jgi:hypothetical protein
VSQDQPGELFDLPKLEIELSTASGVVRKTIHLVHRADTLSLRRVGAVSEVRVDPDHEFLIQRHWGEPVVRFELPVAAPSALGATAVSLSGNLGCRAADDRRAIHVAVAGDRRPGRA